MTLLQRIDLPLPALAVSQKIELLSDQEVRHEQ